jgi:Domain of unknown function (DUF4062)
VCGFPDESDVYLLILGGRYGSIEPKSGKRYTHIEYIAGRSRRTIFSMVEGKLGDLDSHFTQASYSYKAILRAQ